MYFSEVLVQNKHMYRKNNTYIPVVTTYIERQMEVVLLTMLLKEEISVNEDDPIKAFTKKMQFREQGFLTH